MQRQSTMSRNNGNSAWSPKQKERDSWKSVNEVYQNDLWNDLHQIKKASRVWEVFCIRWSNHIQQHNISFETAAV